MRFNPVTRCTLALAAFTMCFAALAGCERKERVLDVKTPGAEVTVDRNVDTGKVEVEAERK